jgi:hypothetical protein
MNVMQKCAGILIVTGLLLSIGYAQQAAPSAQPAVKEEVAKGIVKRNDTLEVIARITEIPGKFVDNDVYNYVYIMKYRVLSVVKGSYKRKEMLVGHYNPLIPRHLVKDKMDPFVDGTVEKFAVGDKHRLQLVKPIEKVWDGAIEDEYYDTDLKKYYALKADAAE